MQELIKEFLAVVEEKGWKRETLFEGTEHEYIRVDIPELPYPFDRKISVIYFQRYDGEIGIEFWADRSIMVYPALLLQGIIKMKDVLGEK
jgi:hypothetical protein